MAIDSFAYFDHTGSAAGVEVRGETTDSFFSKTSPSPAFELRSWKFGSKNKTTIGSATGGAGGQYGLGCGDVDADGAGGVGVAVNNGAAGAHCDPAGGQARGNGPQDGVARPGDGD